MATGIITLDQFIQNHPSGTTVASPENAFAGQCVSLVRQILLQVYGFNGGKLGDAVDFASVVSQAKLATVGLKWLPGDTNFQDGDILVWGDDPGTWTSKYGHIAAWYQGKLYNQNWNNSLKISFNNFFAPGYLGRYTKEEPVPTKQNVIDQFRAFQGSDPTQEQIDYYVTKPWSRLNEDLLVWNRDRRVEQASTIDGLNKMIAVKDKQIADLSKTTKPSELKPGTYIVR